MATVEELIKQYDTDPELKKEVDDISLIRRSRLENSWVL